MSDEMTPDGPVTPLTGVEAALWRHIERHGEFPSGHRGSGRKASESEVRPGDPSRDDLEALGWPLWELIGALRAVNTQGSHAFLVEGEFTIAVTAMVPWCQRCDSPKRVHAWTMYDTDGVHVAMATEPEFRKQFDIECRLCGKCARKLPPNLDLEVEVPCPVCLARIGAPCGKASDGVSHTHRARSVLSFVDFLNRRYIAKEIDGIPVTLAEKFGAFEFDVACSKYPVMCSTCLAPIGSPCETRSGAVMSVAHAARRRSAAAEGHVL